MSLEDHCKRLIKEEKINLNSLTKKLSKILQTDLTTLEEGLVESFYVKYVLINWHESCNEIIKIVIEDLKSEKRNLLRFYRLFRESTFDSFPSFLQDEFYQLIKNDRDLFPSLELSKIITKINEEAKLKFRETLKNEFEFIDCLCEVIRKSDLQYNKIITSLRLKDFIEKVINLQSVIKLIKHFNFSDELKITADNLELNDILEDVVRKDLSPFIKVEKENDSKIHSINCKIIFIEDIQEIPDGIDCVRLNCEIFHIHGIETFNFSFDNLEIYANTIKVHNEITIDVSGKSATQNYIDKKASSSTHGIDGNAGECGGNISIFCDKIVNANLLTLISNGSDGIDGQDGGDGVDGENGRDIQRENLSLNGKPFKIGFFNDHSDLSVSYVFGHYGINYAESKDVPDGKRGILDENDQFYKIGYKYSQINKKGFLLAQGDDGGLGSEGGMGGLGGEGGLCGQIKVEFNESYDQSINIRTSNGSNGRDGEFGFNGKKGIDGRDAWAHDMLLRRTPKFIGIKENEKNKYEVIQGKRSDKVAVWCAKENAYMTVALCFSTNQIESQRNRNKSTGVRSRALHARRKIKKITLKNNFHCEFSEFRASSSGSQILMNDVTKFKVKVTKHLEQIILPSTSSMEYFKIVANFEDVKKEIEKNSLKLSEILQLFKRNNLTDDQWTELCEKNDKNSLSIIDRKINDILTSSDISQLINEKILIINLIKNSSSFKIEENFQEIPEDPFYFIDTKFFKRELNLNPVIESLPVDIASCHFYFNADTEVNREQVKDIFSKIVKDQNENPNIHFNYLILDIFNVMFELRKVIGGEIEKFLENSKKDPEIHEKFLTNNEIQDFIKNNLINEGIRSPIYRRIISFMFSTNFNYYGRGIDGKIFTIDKNEKIYNSTINLLFCDGKFSELQFDELKFMRDKDKENYFKEVAKKFKVVDQILNEEKKNLKDLLEIFFKCLPEVSSEDLERCHIAIIHISQHFSLFLSIFVRFFFEGCQIEINELILNLFTIQEILYGNPVMEKHFATKFLMSPQSKWIIEIILVKLEIYLKEDYEIFQEMLNEVSYHQILVLFLVKLDQLNEDEMQFDDFKKVLNNMKYFTQSSYQQLLIMRNLTSWQHITTSEFWINRFNFITSREISIVNELQSKFGAENLKELLMIMQSKNLEGFLIEDFLRRFNTGEWIFSKEHFKILREKEPKKWIQKINKIYASEDERSIHQIITLIKENDETSDSIKNMLEKLKKVFRDVKYYEEKKDDKVKLKNTQIFSVLTLSQSEDGVLMQIETGEGKTFIGVAFAIYKVKVKGEKIHIVTSSKVLAKRDAKMSEVIFKEHNIKVGHNCHDSIEVRRNVYKDCDVVYGTLGNFQRDFLLTSFYDLNILPGAFLQNVLVDEVDSILLDKGNNILYLSKQLPDVDELEGAFVFIWDWVNQTDKDFDVISRPENIRQAFLDSLYGFVFETDIKALIQDINRTKYVMNFLRENKIIDSEGVILIREELTDLDVPESYKLKILYYLNNKIKSPKVIKFPKYLHNFVMRYLDQWIRSALKAMLMQVGDQYVVDYLERKPTPQNDPNIIILDIDTGTDQKNSEWDEGLCQFLQLKHGCRLSHLSLKSVFISNVSYFKRYKTEYGMTGTLGSLNERQKLKEFYELDYVTVPTHMPKKFNEYEAALTKSNEEWLERIAEEIKDMLEKKRSVLVICNTIKDIQVVSRSLELKKYENIRTYKRDYEEFDCNDLPPRTIIIATNLAGRGTDIRLSEELANNGGLHVILTYLPPNIRIEKQAYGRAARAGAPGSARLIIMNSSSILEIDKLKEQRDQQEQVRLEEVSDFYKKFIKNEEKYFDKFLTAHQKYSKEIEDEKIREILLENFRVKWSLWLDENSEMLKYSDFRGTGIKESFDKLVERCTKTNPLEVDFHPSLRIKYFLVMFDKIKIDEAREILNDKSIEDSITCDYYKIMIHLKERFDIGILKDTNIDINEVVKVLMKLKTIQEEKSHREMIIKTLKIKHRSTFNEIKGFERQSSEFNEVVQIFIESLIKILGTGITPESFNSIAPFGNSIFNEVFYNYLLDKNYISNVMVSNLNKSDIETIAKKYHVDPEKLLKVLEEDRIFDLDIPSREDFWESLVKSEILIKEKTYAIINLKDIGDFLPYTRSLVVTNFDKYKKKFEIKDSREIFLFNIKEDEDKLNNKEYLVIKVKKELDSNELYKNLLKNNIITINKKARLDLSKVKNIKFEKFDGVKLNDFNFLPSFQEKRDFFFKLMRKNILKMDNLDIFDSMESYTLVSGASSKLNSDLNLEEYFIYEKEVKEILTTKFLYRLELERIIEKNENFEDFNINLLSNPHLMMMNELMDNFIIIPSQVNPETLNEFKNDSIWNKKLDKPLEFIQSDLFESDFTIPEELLQNGIKNDKNKDFKESIEILKKYSITLSTLSLIKVSDSIVTKFQRRDLLLKNKKAIFEILTNSLPIFQNKKFTSPKPTLVCLNMFTTSNHIEVLKCMSLKGFEKFISVEEEKYTTKFWINISLMTLLAIAQILLVIIFFKEVKMISLWTGSSVLFEGFRDLYYIFSSLRTGNFSWSDFGSQKVKNLLERNMYYMTVCGLLKNSIKRNEEELNKSFEYKVRNKSDTVNDETTYKSLARGSNIKLINSSIKAKTKAKQTKNVEQMIANALDCLMEETIKEFDKIFEDHFMAHSVKLYQKFNNEEIISDYHKLTSTHDYLEKFINSISEKIETVLTFELKNLDDIKEISFQNLLRGYPMTYLKSSVTNIFFDLNRSQDNNDFMDSDISQGLLEIKKDLMSKIEIKFNRHLRVPALKTYAKEFINHASRELACLIKENSKDFRVKNEVKEAIMENLELNPVKNREEIREQISEIVEKKIKKIIKRNSYFGVNELETASNVFALQIRIKHQGLEHIFGIDHSQWINFNHDTFTYEKLYEIIKSKKGHLSFEEFREKIFENNRKEIKSPNFTGFHKIKQQINLKTKKESEKFTNLKITVEIKKMSFHDSKFIFQPNSDVRLFQNEEYSLAIDTHKSFNLKRNDGINKTLEKINQLMYKVVLPRFTLKDFRATQHVEVKALNGRLFMPVVFETKKSNNTFIKMELTKLDEINSIRAIVTLIYQKEKKKSESKIVLNTLLPSMKNPAVNEVIPNQFSRNLVGKTSLNRIDHTKIFGLEFIDLKLVTMESDEDENLPDVNNCKFLVINK